MFVLEVVEKSTKKTSGPTSFRAQVSPNKNSSKNLMSLLIILKNNTNNILKHILIFLCLRAQIVVVMEVRVVALVEVLIVDMVVREEASEETAEEVD